MSERAWGGVRFDRTINLGHVLTIVTLLISTITAVVVYDRNTQKALANFDKRLALLEQLAQFYVPKVDEAHRGMVELRARLAQPGGKK